MSISFVAAAADRGNYTINGLGRIKQQIIRAGGGPWDIAIARLETDNMTTNYEYGDGKTGDSTNFGIFKQNRFIHHTSTTQFKKYSARDVNKGNILNKKLAQDIKARQESQQFYDADKWFGGHRNGESGLNDPYIQDIASYKNAINWIHDQLVSDEKYLSDDTRFWMYVIRI